MIRLFACEEHLVRSLGRLGSARLKRRKLRGPSARAIRPSPLFESLQGLLSRSTVLNTR